MKVTSFKDMETYIYSSVIVYLKQMNVPDLAFPSPIKGETGDEWLFGVGREPIHREFRRNYQRDQAQARANYQVTLFANGKEYIVATYNPRQKWVKIYERPFKILNAVPLMGKLYEAFYTNTPFGKIITEPEAPRQPAFRHRRNHNLRQPTVDVWDATDSYDEEAYDG